MEGTQMVQLAGGSLLQFVYEPDYLKLSKSRRQNHY
jgi:hypothetical protein